jgi:glycosyltransferase involved in cell wall biosynthesis
MSKKVSIITINYNNLDGLKRTVESVLCQTWQEFEYIVIDGGSIDGSAAFTEGCSDKIDYWVSEPDAGIYNALNKGIQKATGDYLLFLNSGDHFFNDEVLANNVHHLVNHDIIAFDIHMLGLGHDFIHKHPDELLFSFLFEETFAHQSVFISRTLFDNIGLYDENLKIVADWKFFIHALASGYSYRSVHEVLSVFYFDGVSSTAEGTFTRKREREVVLQEEFALYYKDYKLLQKQKGLLEMNRFKMLIEIEKTYLGRKTVSLFFRIYITLFIKKKIKDIVN